MFLQLDPHPIIPLTPNIKIATAIQDVPDLFIFMQVLIEEHLDFLFINITHRRWGDRNLIAILVVTLRCEGVHVVQIGEVEVHDAKLGEVVGINCAAGVVGLTLVAL